MLRDTESSFCTAHGTESLRKGGVFVEVTAINYQGKDMVAATQWISGPERFLGHV
jgi:hypothetical protein